MPLFKGNMEGPIKMLQSLTPDQTKFLGDLSKQILDKGIWLFIVWGGVRLKKSVASIRPQIVVDVIAGVKEHFDVQFAAHAAQFRVHAAQLKEHLASDNTNFAAVHRDMGRMERKIDRMRPTEHAGD